MIASFTLSDIWAGIALLVSIYAAHKTAKFNERQKSLIEVQERLNNLLLKKEEAASAESKKAELGADFIKLGSSKYRLKIWNKGKVAARDVQISFPNGNEIIPDSELSEKFPLEFLEPHRSVELIAAVHLQTKSKQTISLSWADDFQEKNEKTVFATL